MLFYIPRHQYRMLFSHEIEKTGPAIALFKAAARVPIATVER